MKVIAKWIMHHRKTVLVLTALLCVFSVISYGWTNVTEDLSDFLPPGTASTVAINVMNEEYDATSIANLDIMIDNVTLQEAVAYKQKLKAIQGLENVTFLDDSADLSMPLGYIGVDTVEAWYKDNHARYTAYVDTENMTDAQRVIEEIKGVVGENGWVAGAAATDAEAMAAFDSDMVKVFVIALPIILVILLLTTNAWVEPLLFFLTIGIAILLNQGSNFPMGTISSITSTCSLILQLAVSMDYAIFLLDTYNEEVDKGLSVTDAMENAIVASASSISASALTTIIGFLSLTIMEFRLGFDLGMVLAKGVVWSLICTLTVLPCMASYMSRIIVKTKHKKLIPTPKKISKVVSHICIPCLIIAVVITVPSYIAKGRVDFLYGESVKPEGREMTETEKADEAIQAVFDENSSNMMVVMVPRGQMGKERQLYLELKGLDHVSSVISYISMAAESIPVDYVDPEQISLLISENYSRMLLQTDTKAESPEAFALVEEVRAICQKYFPDTWYLAGNSPSYYDLKASITSDDVKVNTLCIAAIALTILFTFRSLFMPVVLVSVIEASIWINVARYYLMGTEMMYMSSLIINAVQLGATVDYAILFAEHYMAARETLKRRAAVERTLQETLISILTSASIICIAGTILGKKSGNAYVAQIGELIGTGGAISGVLVILVLPAALMVFDFLLMKVRLPKRAPAGKLARKLAAKENPEPALAAESSVQEGKAVEIIEQATAIQEKTPEKEEGSMTKSSTIKPEEQNAATNPVDVLAGALAGAGRDDVVSLLAAALVKAAGMTGTNAAEQPAPAPEAKAPETEAVQAQEETNETAEAVEPEAEEAKPQITGPELVMADEEEPAEESDSAEEELEPESTIPITVQVPYSVLHGENPVTMTITLSTQGQAPAASGKGKLALLRSHESGSAS